MKSLSTLIKLRKYNIDQLVSHINTKQQAKLSLEKEVITMQNTITDEAMFCHSHFRYSFNFDGYLKHILDNIKELESKITQYQSEIDELREATFTEFGELKKFEIIKQRLDHQELIKLSQEEVKHIDEANSKIYQKNS